MIRTRPHRGADASWAEEKVYVDDFDELFTRDKPVIFAFHA